MAKEKGSPDRELAFLLNQPYTFSIQPDPDESAIAIWVNELPGCISQGKTLDDAYNNIRDAIELWIKTRMEMGMDIPVLEYSGKIFLRVSPTLHQRLASQAKRNGMSLNAFISQSLSYEVGFLDGQGRRKMRATRSVKPRKAAES